MLVQVFEIPQASGNFHFGGGEDQIFVEVDWFRDDEVSMSTEKGRSTVVDFIKSKNYFNEAKAYLILHPTNSVTINYEAS